ncbi:MAG: arginyltransferase [Halieaceae bacterium]|nr:arginyltransferase [Halieaceae bacterium]
MTSSLRDLKVYTTYPHSCSYLPEQEATTLFVDPRTPMSSSLYSQLSLLGFRRSGSHLYRPNCSNCSACIPARVPVERFEAKRNQRRAWRRNLDIEVRELEDISGDEPFELYRRYIEERHHDGDMYPPSRDQYQSFLSAEWGVTRFYGMFHDGRLVGVAVADLIDDGLSAIYTFYDPDLQDRSLGTFAVLWQIEATREMGLDYVYLGYWIKQCQKMAYKIQYRPLELYINGSWVELL